MAHVRLFAAARDAAGTGRDVLPGETVGAVLDAARARYGVRFADVLETSRIWVNGEPADAQDAIAAADELAVLPPVSGGATADLVTADPATVDVPTEREPT
jgi:sulfur-carrier protein